MEKIHRHFEDELASLSDKVLRLAGLAEDAIGKSIQALLDRNSDLATQVIADDEIADRLELEIDHLCTDILARFHPLARDLRFVATAMKITPEFERIADLATQVCERVLELNDEPRLALMVDLPFMASRAQSMLRRVIEAYVQQDAGSAREILKMDDELDRRMDQAFRVLVTLMLEDPKVITRALRLMMVAKSYERMGDQVTNIAEMVVYMVEGRVIKHMGDEGFKGPRPS